MIQLVKDTCALDLGMLGTIPFDTAVRKAACRFTPFVVEDPRSKSSQALHRVLSGILLLREPKSIRAELLKKSGRIRGEIKNRIDKDDLQLDEQPSRKIQTASGPLPKPRTRFQKILGSMAT